MKNIIILLLIPFFALGQTTYNIGGANLQGVLVSGTDIKTVNGQSLIGSGNIVISGDGSIWGGITGTLSNQTDLQTALNGKLATNGNGSNLTGLTALQVGLGNVTDESKPTMFNNATFTGTFAVAAGSISNAALANSAVANLSGTNTGDNAVNTLYSGLVSNATHTGDATGSTALTVVRINGVALSGLATGILKNTTSTGVPSIAVAGDFPTLNQNTTGSAATLTTPRLIGGVSFNGSADIGSGNDLLAYQALGSPILAETVSQSLAYSNTSTAMVDGQIKYEAVYLSKAATLTGVKVYVRVLGAYTGDNNNRIGLYSYSGGTLTLVASSANSATLWTSAANSIQTIPFSSTYAAAAGIYFVGLIYNQSAQTTAPSLASGIALNNLVMGSTALGFTNSAKLHGTSTGTDLPASVAMSAITSSVIPSWVSLY